MVSCSSTSMYPFHMISTEAKSPMKKVKKIHASNQELWILAPYKWLFLTSRIHWDLAVLIRFLLELLVFVLYIWIIEFILTLIVTKQYNSLIITQRRISWGIKLQLEVVIRRSCIKASISVDVNKFIITGFKMSGKPFHDAKHAETLLSQCHRNQEVYSWMKTKEVD